MGPASDPDSVVDSEGRVHGIEGLYVADASLMPAVTSGNTNMPTAVIGERIARSLLGLASSDRDRRHLSAEQRGRIAGVEKTEVAPGQHPQLAGSPFTAAVVTIPAD